MSTNIDSTAILVAGQVTPLIFVPTYGIVGLKSGVNALSVPLTTSSLSVSSGGNNGGILLSVYGTGFPIDKSQMTITVCNNKATIKSITNIRADFYLPACGTIGNQNVVVQVGSLTSSTQSFLYVDGSTVAPKIISLNPVSANPGLKGTL